MKKYVHSGKFEAGSVAIWTLIGLVAGGVISVIYTAIANWNPYIYLNFAVLLGVIWALSRAVVIIIKKSKSRNRGINLLVAFLICLFSWYVGWVALQSYLAEINFFALLIDPVAVIDNIFYYADNVNMTLNDSPMEPEVLKICYGIELLAFFVPMIIVAKEKLYYCEFCEGFMKEKDYYITETELVGQHLDGIKMGNLEFLDQIEMMQDKLNTNALQQYKLNLHQCGGCGDRVFNFTHLTLKIKKDKAEIKKTRSIVQNTYAIRPVQE